MPDGARPQRAGCEIGRQADREHGPAADVAGQTVKQRAQPVRHAHRRRQRHDHKRPANRPSEDEQKRNPIGEPRQEGDDPHPQHGKRTDDGAPRVGVDPHRRRAHATHSRQTDRRRGPDPCQAARAAQTTRRGSGRSPSSGRCRRTRESARRQPRLRRRRRRSHPDRATSARPGVLMPCAEQRGSAPRRRGAASLRARARWASATARSPAGRNSGRKVK